MVVTDEPGVYIKDKLGIRTENVLLVKKMVQNDDGTFLTFEPLTYVPIDKKGIDTTYMTREDIRILNEYHAAVFERIAPYLETEEKEWLRHVTLPLN
jgi:Xaa-Pro aminopeptidase